MGGASRADITTYTIARGWTLRPKVVINTLDAAAEAVVAEHLLEGPRGNSEDVQALAGLEHPS